VALLVARRRRIPRRLGGDRRCDDLEPRPFLQREIATIRCAGLGDRALVRQYARPLSEDRRPHDRDLHEVTVQLLSLHGPDHADGQPNAMGEGRAQVDGICQDAFGDGTVPHHQGSAGPIRRNEPQRGLLGQGPHSEARETDRDPDAGGDDTARRLAFGPGRLDRGTATRRHPLVESSGIPDQPLALPTCLAVHSQRDRGFSVSGPARAQGPELRDRSRRARQVPERQSRPTGSTHRRTPISASPSSATATTPKRRRLSWPKPVTARIIRSRRRS
jgi:hypothetical protein